MDRLRQIEGLIYLGSPYSKYPDGIEAAYRDVCRVAANLLRAGVTVYSPIAHTHGVATHGEIDPYDHKIWLPADQIMIDVSAALLIAKMDGWQESFGLKYEVEAFARQGKPIFLIEPVKLEIVSACDAELGAFAEGSPFLGEPAS